MKTWDWDISLTEPIEVQYEYDAGEEEVTYYSDGSGHPATPSDVVLLKFMYQGEDITDLVWELAHHKKLDELEHEICEHEDTGGSYDCEDYWDKDE